MVGKVGTGGMGDGRNFLVGSCRCAGFGSVGRANLPALADMEILAQGQERAAGDSGPFAETLEVACTLGGLGPVGNRLSFADRFTAAGFAAGGGTVVMATEDPVASGRRGEGRENVADADRRRAFGSLVRLEANPPERRVEAGKPLVLKEGCVMVEGYTREPADVALFTEKLSGAGRSWRVTLERLDRRTEKADFTFRISIVWRADKEQGHGTE